MTRTFIDINVLQTVPPSNINRDDTGSPKTAYYGGVRRARVSSQAWKRATRSAFKELLDPSSLGVRTKRVVEVVAQRISSIDVSFSEADALEAAKQVLLAAGIKLTAPRVAKGQPDKTEESGYLLFLSSLQVSSLAGAAIAASKSDDPQGVFKVAGLKKKLQSENSVDIALFGRMLADSKDLNVDAAAQVAHALSVHAVESEFDYFTAIDDHKASSEDEDAGAGMIGTVEFNSSTLYRYATVDLNALERNLGDSVATQKAVEAFVQAFSTSMPTGKQNTFANRTLPDAIVVSIRDTQPVNLVGAFENAVVGSARQNSASEKLAKYSQEVDAAFGTTPVKSWVVRVSELTSSLSVLGEAVSLPELVAAVGEFVGTRLEVKK